MLREEKILAKIKKEGTVGVEIGASHSPIAPKRAGYNVHIIDHATRAELREKYKDEGVNLDNIEEVDFVWRGESYAELTGKKHYYDWIIASHVVEHSPDLIAFLNSCDEILKDEGLLSLAVPDVRFCFDHFRPPSGLAKAIDAHLDQRKAHTPGSVAEYRLNFVEKSGYQGWGESVWIEDEYKFIYGLDNAIALMKESVAETGYSDCHNWCFTPHSFRLLIRDLNDFGFIKMKELSFFPSAGCEFFITLGRHGAGSGLERIELLREIKNEMLFTLEPEQLLKTGAARMRQKLRDRYWKFKSATRQNLGRLIRGKK
jgi:SAM-dependent methyltransferase